MITVLICQECEWNGEQDELVSTTNDPDNFSHCPRCEGTNFTEEEDDSDETLEDEDDILDDEEEDEDEE